MKPNALRTAYLMQTLNRLGFTIEESLDLFKIERTLHRWHERECNGEIDRDQKTGKVYGVYLCHRRGNHIRTKLPLRDLESSTLRKLAGIMKNHPGLTSYVQGDPRGAALYILEAKDLQVGKDIGSYYSKGLCVYNR